MPPDPEIPDLGVLIGTWRTEGEVSGDDGETPGRPVDGYDHYEWLGPAFVIHRIDVDMRGDRVQGLEVIAPPRTVRWRWRNGSAPTTAGRPGDRGCA